VLKLLAEENDFVTKINTINTQKGQIVGSKTSKIPLCQKIIKMCFKGWVEKMILFSGNLYNFNKTTNLRRHLSDILFGLGSWAF
jgi:hypothetical protein